MENNDMGALVRLNSLDEVLAHRDRAIEAWQRGAALLQEAESAKQRALACFGYGFSGGICPEVKYKLEAIDVRKEIDRDVWLAVMRITAMDDVMSATAKEAFRDQLEKDPPEATMDNIRNTVSGWAARRVEQFDAGLLEVFSRLSHKYKSNGIMKFEKKTVFRGNGSSGWYAYSVPWIDDLERVVCVVSGVPAPENGEKLSRRIPSYTHGRDIVPGHRFFKVDTFENGNVHIAFRDAKALEMLNARLAKVSGGNILGGNKEAR